MPVAAAIHTCKDKATAVELGLPLVAAKNPLSFIEHLVPRGRYCMCHIFMFKVLHSRPSNPLWPHFSFDVIFSPYFSIFFHVCAKPVCFDPIVFKLSMF